MSGTLPKDCDVRQRYQERLNELRQKNPNKSFAQSMFGSSNESVVYGQNFINKGQVANGSLSTQQFYKNNSNHDQFRSEKALPNQFMEGSSTYTSASDASEFKKPYPVKRFDYRSDFRIRLDLVIDVLRSFEDKQTIKFILTAMENLAHTLKNPPFAPPVDPVQLMEYISNSVKDKYFSKRVPKSICGSSVISERISTTDQYRGSSECSVRLDRSSVNSAVPDPRIILQDITNPSFHQAQRNRTLQGPSGSEYSAVFGRTVTSHQQQEASTAIAAARRCVDIPPAHQQALENLIENGISFNFLNDSEIARRRDEAAARQEDSMSAETFLPKKNSKELPKATKKPSVNSSKISGKTKGSPAAANKKQINRRSKEAVPATKNCPVDQSNQSLLNGTTRPQRVRKAPVKYWNSKGDEMSFEEPGESALNESMILRNKKILDKIKSSNGSKNNTPTLPVVSENGFSKPSTNKRGRPKGQASSAEKENVVEKKKPVGKLADTPVIKNVSSRVKTNKKKEDLTNLRKENEVKKSAPKRKSKQSNTTSKKKKIEDPLASDMEDDDIFGTIGYRKPTNQNFKVALSPSGALLSAKKAAGEAEGRATPPCKAIGDLMGDDSFQSIMSAAKEAPKQNEAVKRIIKKMEKDQMKPPSQKPKTKTHKGEKEDSRVNKLMNEVKLGTFSVENPFSSATITVFRGEEQESDSSEMEQDDYDDLL